MKKTGLGRNLSALLSKSIDEDANISLPVKMVELAQIVPSALQPRTHFNEEQLLELSASIARQGLLQPIVVRLLEDSHYEILAGERRWRACHLAKLDKIPVMIKNVSDEEAIAIALIENLQRQDLNVLEKARAIKRLTIEFELTHDEVANLLSQSRVSVTNCLRLLELDASISELLEKNLLDMGHARCLLTLPLELQQDIAKRIISQGLSVRATEALIQKIKSYDNVKQESPNNLVKKYKPLIMQLKKNFNTNISLKQNTLNKGSIVIKYENEEQLLSFLNKLQAQENVLEEV